MEPRVTASILAGALLRAAEAEGGFGTVLAKGDATAGAILLILLERGANPRAFERVLTAGGTYSWQAVSGELAGDSALVPSLVERRRRFDPDLWVLELDIPFGERFAAELDRFG